MGSALPTATLDNWREHPQSVWGFTHVDSLVPVAPVPTAPPPAALRQGKPLDLARLAIVWAGSRRSAEAALEETHTDGFMVLKDGAVVAERLINETATDRHIVFSVSKSITAALAGILVQQGKLDPEAPISRYVPEVAGSAYADATVRHVLDMAVSIRFVEDYLDPQGDVARYRAAMGWNPPGAIASADGINAFVTSLPKAEHPHGRRFHYVSPNSDLLGWIIERAAGENFASLLSRLVWQPMHMAQDAYVTVDRHGAPRTAGGICVSLGDMARFGEMMRNKGRYNGQRIVPEEWINDILHKGDAAQWSRGEMVNLFPDGRYRSKWYVPDPSSNVLCAIGIHGQWIYIDYDAGMVAVKQSSQPIPADEALDNLTYAMFQTIADELR
jgi:CubicO group peptidase (beta-lactamase class C family)